MTSVADRGDAAAGGAFPAIASRRHRQRLSTSMRCRTPAANARLILVRRFLERLATGDESCAAAVPAVRLVPRFARHASELAPAHGLAGNRAAEAQLRVVNAALLTCEIVIAASALRTDRAGAWDCAAARFSVVASAAAGYRLESSRGALERGSRRLGGCRLAASHRGRARAPGAAGPGRPRGRLDNLSLAAGWPPKG